MSKFKVGDYVIVNKDGCFAHECAEYHAVVTEELGENRYCLCTIDEDIRDCDQHFGIDRYFRCLARYMVIDETYTVCEDDDIDISTLLL